MYRPLPSSGGADPALVGRVEALEARGPYRRHLLGIHAILSGIAFDRSALLAEPWMIGIDENTCDVELYLVGGGGAGAAQLLSTTSTQAPQGGMPGCVRIVRGIPISEIQDGMAMEIGAGAVPVVISGTLSLNSAPGGSTRFGIWRADGAYGTFRSETLLDTYISDVRLGRPGLYNVIPALVQPLDALPSAGPGGGGSPRNVTSTGTIRGVGGHAGWPDLDTSLPGGDIVGSPNGRDADPASFGYGSGGAGGQGSTPGGQVFAAAGNGGFPGGAGGGHVGAAGEVSGAGGNGVIRLAVYDWRLA